MFTEYVKKTLPNFVNFRHLTNDFRKKKAAGKRQPYICM
jgi:hypothetical protein